MVGTTLCGGSPGLTGASIAAVGSSGAPTIEDIVLVTTDPAANIFGCESINVHRDDTGETLFLGPPSNSPSRLAASPDLSVAVTINSALGFWSPSGQALNVRADQPSPEPAKQWIYLIRRKGNDWSQWDAHNRIVGAEFAMAGGLAILPDGDTLLAATAHPLGGSGSPIGPPYRVEKYRPSEITPSASPWATDEILGGV